MPALDTDHTWELTIAGVDRTSALSPDGCTWREADAGRATSFDFHLLDFAQALSFDGWEEVILTSDPGEAGEAVQFGGYLTRWTPTREGPSTERGWDLHAEGYGGRMERAAAVAKAYVGQTPAQIIDSLLGLAGFGDFGLDIETGAAIALFVVAEGDKLIAALDRLMLLADPTDPWTWRVDAAKTLLAGPADTTAAAFAIKDAQAGPDYSASFPPSAGSVAAKADALEMANRVRVVGGQSQSDDVTDNFLFADAYVNGDGDFVFNLSHTIVSAFLSVTRTRSGATYQYLANPDDWGWDWYTPVGRKIYLDKDAGAVRFISSELTTGDTVVIIYRWLDRVDVTAVNAALYASMGFYLDHAPVYDPALTTEQAATDYADAVLTLAGAPKVDGALTVERLGLHAGHWLAITSALHDLSGSYLIRQIVHTLDAAGARVKSEITFGDAMSVLADLVSAATSPPPAAPEQVGDVGNQYIKGAIIALAPDTSFTPP